MIFNDALGRKWVECDGCGRRLQMRPISCPDGKPGCAVLHQKVEPCPNPMCNPGPFKEESKP